MEAALKISRKKKNDHISNIVKPYSLFVPSAIVNDFKHSTRVITRFRTSFTSPV